ncbi:hypothetical protein [Burkholderia ubonensis]|uniref:hypothetical protein n=1 Tax=Burkholderia ubonensis TaxID=101571 RepID=UPI0011149C36|nr:hypothetical protein [Burkholderia ubonensis]
MTEKPVNSPNQDMQVRANAIGLNIENTLVDNSGQIFLNANSVNQDTGIDTSGAAYRDAPAATIGHHTAIPQQSTRTDLTTPVAFLSPSPLSGNSPEDQYIQGKISKDDLPESIKNDSNAMTALDDIRVRYDPDFELKSKAMVTMTPMQFRGSKSPIANAVQVVKGRPYKKEINLESSIERANPHQPKVTPPKTGSYVRHSITIPGHMTQSGNPATIHGYAKVTSSGHAGAPTSPYQGSGEYNFYSSQTTISNNMGQIISVAPRDGKSNTQSQVNSNSQSDSSSVQAAAGFSVSPGGAGAGFTFGGGYSQGTTQTNQDTNSNQNFHESGRTFGTLTVKQGDSITTTNYQSGTFHYAGLKDVHVSNFSPAIFQGLYSMNSTPSGKLFDTQYDNEASGSQTFSGGGSIFYRNMENGKQIFTISSVSSTGNNDILVPSLHESNSGTAFH